MRTCICWCLFTCFKPHKYVFQEDFHRSDRSDGIDSNDNGVVDCEDSTCEDCAHCVGDSEVPEDTASVEKEINEYQRTTFLLLLPI